MTIELTAEVDLNAVPQQIADRVKSRDMSWVRIRARAPSGACIAHPADLQQFVALAREAVRNVQDSMHASHVHLIGVAPASALFRFGQLLQPGHHCAFTVYDKADASSPFRSALKITGSQVEDATQLDDADRTIIQLR